MNDYKRLTHRSKEYIDTNCGNCKQWKKFGNHYACMDMSACDEEIIKRLAELEDKIENKTLIELPCKVGDKVYHLSSKTIREEIVTNVEYVITKGEISVFNSYIFTNDPYDKDDNFYRFSKLGKSLFLTKAEAEAKLKALKKDD